MRKLRVGIVGCGTISAYHGKFIKEHPQAELCAVVDKDERALKQAGERYGVSALYTDIDEMLSSKQTDIIHILTPPQTHAPLATKALLAGNHVLVEKPLALNYQDALSLYRLASERGLKLCVDHNHMFDPWMVEARRILEGYRYEDIVYVESYYGINPQIPEIMDYRGANEISWIFNLPGGLFHDFIAHPLYLMLEYTGSPLHVHTVGRSHGALFQNLSDELHVLISGENAVGKMTISFNAKPYQHFLKIYHKKINLCVDFNNMSLVALPTGKLPSAAMKIVNNLSSSKQLTGQTIRNVFNFVTGKLKPYSGMRTLIYRFYDAVSLHQPLPVTQKQALDVMQTMDSVWRYAGRLHPTFQDVRVPAASEPRHAPRILVTGAGGFLGRRLVEVLVERGYIVRVFVRKLTNITQFIRLGVEVCYGDMKDEIALQKAFDGVDYVVHAAAAQKGDRQEFEETTIQGTRNVFALSRKTNIRRVIYISSMSVYQAAGLKKGTLIAEDSAFEQDAEARGHYTWSKLEAERFVNSCHNGSSVPTVILRPATIYGPRGPVFSPLIGLSLFDKVLVVLGKKKMALPLVHIDNVVEAIIQSIEKPQAEGQTFNVIDDTYLTKAEYIKAFKEHFRGSRAIYLPYWGVYGLVALQEHLCRRLGRAPFLTRYRLESASSDLRFSNKRIKEILGWKPVVSTKHGLEECFTWHRANA